MLWAAGSVAVAAAQGSAAPSAARDERPPAERGVNEWLARMHEASRVRSYIGTFVVSSSSGAMSAARIWHAGEDGLQLERVETLTGARRSTFRRNDEVLTFLPEQRTVVAEKREHLGVFPELLQAGGAPIADFYALRELPGDRVAGFEADVVQLAPRDHLRFGYRIWSERKTGLVVKMQTLDAESRVLEQAAFSELQLEASVPVERLARMMTVPRGWRVERPDAIRTTAAEQGWVLRQPVPGFRPISSYLRPQGEGTLQWIFSDGLASVSLFLETYDAARHLREGAAASGATHTLTRRVQDWWLTAVGEVPAQTLKTFAANLERRK